VAKSGIAPLIRVNHAKYAAGKWWRPPMVSWYWLIVVAIMAGGLGAVVMALFAAKGRDEP
jgi:hypothetical protein